MGTDINGVKFKSQFGHYNTHAEPKSITWLAERIFADIEVALGYPNNQPYQFTATIFSDLWQSLKDKYIKPLPVDGAIRDRIAKKLYEQEFSAGYWDVGMSKGDKVKWYVKADSILSDPAIQKAFEQSKKYEEGK